MEEFESTKAGLLCACLTVKGYGGGSDDDGDNDRVYGVVQLFQTEGEE